jgi:hypothetical protein
MFFSIVQNSVLEVLITYTFTYEVSARELVSYVQ